MTELHWRSAGGSRGRDPRSRGVVARGARPPRRPDRAARLRQRRRRVRRRTSAGASADAADAAVVRGDELGPLHGVPMTIKDSFSTAGCVTTSGAPELADHVPAADAAPVARLREAGAIPFAKTNLPIFAGDIQSFNDVYGTTDNPYDRRAPAADRRAALRQRSRWGSRRSSSAPTSAARSACRPTTRASPATSRATGSCPGTARSPACRARSARPTSPWSGRWRATVDDLELVLDVLAGPDRWSAPAWRVELPPPRATSLGDLRIAALARRRPLPGRRVDAARARFARHRDRGRRRARRHRGAARVHAREGDGRVRAAAVRSARR